MTVRRTIAEVVAVADRDAAKDPPSPRTPSTSPPLCSHPTGPCSPASGARGC
jgi:hypothetical protein